MGTETAGAAGAPLSANDDPWLDARGAAARARCGVKTIYAAVRGGRLRAARLTARRELRIHREWIDAWIVSCVAEVNPRAPGPRVAPFGGR